MKPGDRSARVASRDFRPSEIKPEKLCRQCRRAKVDEPKSKSLCVWCRLGEVVASSPPPPEMRGSFEVYKRRRPRAPGIGRARPVFDDQGRRVCEQCRHPLVKKDPKGRGRYPRLCDTCKEAA